MDEKERQEPVNPAGMPEIHPPEGGPNRDPNVPDPGDLVPGRPGPPPDTTPDEDERDRDRPTER